MSAQSEANTIILDLYDTCFQALCGIIGEPDAEGAQLKMKTLAMMACNYCVARLPEIQELEKKVMKRPNQASK